MRAECTRALIAAVCSAALGPLALMLPAHVAAQPSQPSMPSPSQPSMSSPPSAAVPVERTDANSRIAHQQLLEKARSGRIDVYFAGDSITRRWGATDYPHLLAHWRETFHGWNAANFAWGGDSTQHMLWRLQNGELDGLEPKVFVLLAGTNNVGAALARGHDVDAADIAAGVEALVHEMRARVPAAEIVLTAIFPRNDHAAALPAIAQINAQLERFAQRERLHFIDINDRLADEAGRLSDEFSDDGLHLNAAGYAVWAEALVPRLADLLGPPAGTDDAPPPTGDPSASGR